MKKYRVILPRDAEGLFVRRNPQGKILEMKALMPEQVRRGTENAVVIPSTIERGLKPRLL